MLLLFNLRNVGHFTVYGHNLILWAISRGMKVICCGLNAESTDYYAHFSDHPKVRFLDASYFLGLGDGQLSDTIVLERLCKGEGLERQIRALRMLQREFSPQATVLLQADEFFFNYPLEQAKTGIFTSATYGIVTFGHRDRYTGYDEKYSWRLRKVIREGSFFTRLLTIDEYHAAFEDPVQSFMVYLPDPCQVVDGNRSPVLGERLHPDAAALQRFLDADKRPVVPVAGKFDERKNNLWLLEEVVARPGLRCVVLGERIPSPDCDFRIDDLLLRLEREGRIFCRFGFVPDIILNILFSSPRVEFAAFPYLAHYGSSGIHLMAVENGKPCLVPDNGLMGRRTYDAGIGILFRHGDRRDFRRQFARLADGEIKRIPGNFSIFSTAFGHDSMFAALDYAFGLRSAPPPLPPWTQSSGYIRRKKAPIDLANEAMDLVQSGALSEGLARLGEALALVPNHASLLFRRFVLLLRTGDVDDCLTAWRQVMKAGGAACEARFFFQRVTEYLRDIPAGEGIYDERKILSVLTSIAQDPDQLRGLGGLLAARGEHIKAEKTFARALMIAPERDDIRLNLSDVRRYAGCLADSHAILDEIAMRSPDTPGLWCKRGQIFAVEGRVEEARSALKREIATGGPFVELAESWLDKLA